MTTVQPTVQWFESSLQSPPEFRIPFESSPSKTSLLSSSPSAPPWPWPSCWPPCWPRGYWGRPGPGRGPHIYFTVWTFQIGRAAAGTGKGKICLFKTSVVCWAEQDVEALLNFFLKSVPLTQCMLKTAHKKNIVLPKILLYFIIKMFNLLTLIFFSSDIEHGITHVQYFPRAAQVVIGSLLVKISCMIMQENWHKKLYLWAHFLTTCAHLRLKPRAKLPGNL